MSGRSPLRAEYLLPVACLVSAVTLGASELMNTFALRPPGGETLKLLEAGDRHNYALLVLAIFAVIALAVTVVTGSKPAAVAVAAAGILALFFFLVIDLPHVSEEGTLSDFASSKAYPASGFWLEMLGAVGLAVSGGALATLSEDQLARIARIKPPRRRATRRRPTPPQEAEPPAPSPARGHASGHRRERERELAARRTERRRRGGT